MVETNIRPACLDDMHTIQALIKQLGYEMSTESINRKLNRLLQSTNDKIYLYESKNQIQGIITLHFSVQLAFEKDFMSIGYLVVDENYRNLKIGDKLMKFAEQIAVDKNCTLIEVFSREDRTDAHRFYLKQGYKEASKLFVKEL